MRYFGLPAGICAFFKRSFRFNLSAILGYSEGKAKAVTKAAKSKYKEIVLKLPEFEKGDRFKTNIVNCAMFSAFCLELPERPPLEEMAVYYRESMTTGAMKLFCRMSGKRKFSARDIAGMERTAAVHAPTVIGRVLFRYSLPTSSSDSRSLKCFLFLNILLSRQLMAIPVPVSPYNKMRPITIAAIMTIDSQSITFTSFCQ